jgi:hypothetical protein
MFSVSEYSQIHRLERILERNGMLVEGKLVRAGPHVSGVDQQEIREIMTYLNDNGLLKDVESWFSLDISSSLMLPCDSSSRACISMSYQHLDDLLTNLLGVRNEKTYLSVRPEYIDEPVRVTGYEYVTVANGNRTDETVNGVHYRFELDKETLMYSVYENKKVIATVPLKEFFKKLSDAFTKTGETAIPREQLSFVFENKDIKMKVYFTSISESSDGFYSNQQILYSVK